MARLKMLRDTTHRVAPQLAYLSALPGGATRQRDITLPWRAWYKTARWQRLRWSVLVRDLFTCRRCHRLVADTSQLVADHIIRHRGNEALFWDAGNLQCLCKPCHDSAKQSEERR